MNVTDTLTLAFGIAKGIDTGLQEAQRKIDAGAKSLAHNLLSPLKAALGGAAGPRGRRTERQPSRTIKNIKNILDSLQ